MPKQLFAQSVDPASIVNIGSPQQIIEKILHQHEVFGHQRYLAQIDFGGMPYDRVMEQIETIGSEIIPAVKKYTAATRGRRSGWGRTRGARLMKVVALSGSNVGTKTRTVMEYVTQSVMKQDPDIEVDAHRPRRGRHGLRRRPEFHRVHRRHRSGHSRPHGRRCDHHRHPDLPGLDPGDTEERLRSAAGQCFSGQGPEHGRHGRLGQALPHPAAAAAADPVLHEGSGRPAYVRRGEGPAPGQIVNEDVIQRLDRLVEDTIVLTRTYSEIREAADAAYGF
jgi:hypothetical protein